MTRLAEHLAKLPKAEAVDRKYGWPLGTTANWRKLLDPRLTRADFNTAPPLDAALLPQLTLQPATADTLNHFRQTGLSVTGSGSGDCRSHNVDIRPHNPADLPNIRTFIKACMDKADAIYMDVFGIHATGFEYYQGFADAAHSITSNEIFVHKDYVQLKAPWSRPYVIQLVGSNVKPTVFVRPEYDCTTADIKQVPTEQRLYFPEQRLVMANNQLAHSHNPSDDHRHRYFIKINADLPELKS